MPPEAASPPGLYLDIRLEPFLETGTVTCIDNKCVLIAFPPQVKAFLGITIEEVDTDDNSFVFGFHNEVHLPSSSVSTG